MNESWQKPLDELLADLPRDIPPPRYLWRGIRVRLDHSPRRARPLVFAAAACVLGACVASVLTWAVMHGRPASRNGGRPAIRDAAGALPGASCE